jgi:hypothetical protein
MPKDAKYPDALVMVKHRIGCLTVFLHGVAGWMPNSRRRPVAALPSGGYMVMEWLYG